MGKAHSTSSFATGDMYLARVLGPMYRSLWQRDIVPRKREPMPSAIVTLCLRHRLP